MIMPTTVVVVVASLRVDININIDIDIIIINISHQHKIEHRIAPFCSRWWWPAVQRRPHEIALRSRRHSRAASDSHRTALSLAVGARTVPINSSAIISRNAGQAASPGLQGGRASGVEIVAADARAACINVSAMMWWQRCDGLEKDGLCAHVRGNSEREK